MTRSMIYKVFAIATACTMLIAIVCKADAASQVRQANDMSTVNDAIHQAVQTYGGQHVLVVYDIDNTLLTPPVGYEVNSTQWYNWQISMLKNDPQSTCLVGHDEAHIIAAQTVILSVTKMQLVEPNEATQIASLQAKGVAVIAETARGYVTYSQTQDELIANNINMQATDIGSAEKQSTGIAGNFSLPGFTRAFKYTDGIALTAGQDKGKFLIYLLHRFGESSRYHAIFFIDDSAQNVADVAAAFSSVPNVTVTAFHYNHQLDRVQKFIDEPKQTVCNRWRAIKTVVQDSLDKPL